jgi:hypothetical protein
VVPFDQAVDYPALRGQGSDCRLFVLPHEGEQSLPLTLRAFDIRGLALEAGQTLNEDSANPMSVRERKERERLARHRLPLSALSRSPFLDHDQLPNGTSGRSGS